MTPRLTFLALPAALLTAVPTTLVGAQPAAEQAHGHAPGAADALATHDALRFVETDGQPLAANIQRLTEALDYLGAALPAALRAELARAGQERDARKLQELLDPHVLFGVHINPEVRVKVGRGPAPARLQQAGYAPVIVKIVNESSGTQRMRIGSPQAGPVYAGMTMLSAARMQQTHLRENENIRGRTDRFLELEMFTAPPMTATLSGLEVEYALALIYSHEAGRREATITFDVGQGTQDLGFRGELPILFETKPAIAVKLNVHDHDGTPTMGRFQFIDKQDHVFPPQAKRLAPDLFFQKHIYRADGESVLLPPGEFSMFYGRGPEYRWVRRAVTIPTTSGGDTAPRGSEITVKLERWVDPAAYGFFSGDHHIHASGCAHYTLPSEGVEPADMFRQVKGEALNVGSVLTWGPGFDYQQKFFADSAHPLSESRTQLKYDIEVSGFGSAALGHVCLLNLKEQIYPGATASKGWPSWTLPVLRWTKAQGGFGGYAHSGSGLQSVPKAAARRLLDQFDADKDNQLNAPEAERALLPRPFAAIDENANGRLSEAELVASHDRVADELPNLAIPELDSVGAQEIFVTAAHGVCDFISAMDTHRIREWNAWYHLLNCGLPVKASGETDFPCMSGTRVGQGRTYVQLGRGAAVDYAKWCQGMAEGRSYVSDGYAHALEFTVNGRAPGDDVSLPVAGKVSVRATVAFSPETPLEPTYGGAIPAGGRRNSGDTIVMYETQSIDPVYQRGNRLVELIINGRVAASREVPADGKPHAVEFSVPIERSSWVALRQFPQLHTNPVDVLIGGKPIRASRDSVRWALACIDQLWRARGSRIAAAERGEAEKAYEEARAFYRRILPEVAQP